jgi:hypothetical protein
VTFVRRSIEPPLLEEGKVVEAEITDIEWPVEGKNGPQVLFKLVLANGFNFKDWAAFYEEPSDRSRLGELCLTLMKMKKTEYPTLDDALKALKEYRRILVQCHGFREFRGRKFPRLKVVTDRLPYFQEKLDESQSEKTVATTTVTLTTEDAEKLKELLGKR